MISIKSEYEKIINFGYIPETPEDEILTEEEMKELPKEPRTLSAIAREIYRDWKPVNYAAKPYLEAMNQLDSINDRYYQDSGTSIVAYFLSNASSWKGDVAKKIKAELKEMLKRKK